MNPTDVLFSRFIRARDGGCIMVTLGYDPQNCWGELQAAHLISRRFKAVRWDERNAVALCAGHHDYYTRHPRAWHSWRLEFLGAGRFADLLHTAYHGPRPDEKAIRADLRKRLRSLLAGWSAMTQNVSSTNDEAEAGLLILDDLDRGNLPNETRDAIRKWYEEVVRSRG